MCFLFVLQLLCCGQWISGPVLNLNITSDGTVVPCGVVVMGSWYFMELSFVRLL